MRVPKASSLLSLVIFPSSPFWHMSASWKCMSHSCEQHG
jgi:hypothetical protein